MTSITSIYKHLDEVYDGVCTTFSNTELRGIHNVDGKNVAGMRITRSSLFLVKDTLGFVYVLRDACLHRMDDAQVIAICKDCENSWHTKYLREDSQLVAFTEEHRPLFKRELRKQSKELEKILKDTPKKERSIKYLNVVGNYIDDLSLIEDKLILEAEGANYMTGVIRRIRGEDKDIYVIIEVEDINGEFLIKSGLVRGEETCPIMEISKDPVLAYAKTAVSLDIVLTNRLKRVPTEVPA